MTAKVKAHPFHNSSKSPSHRPRGTSEQAFQKVYWPFIPMVLIAGMLLAMAFQTGAITSYVRSPIGRVLSYVTQQDPNAVLDATNAERRGSGQSELKLNDLLSRAASVKAQDMASRNYWSHNTPENTPPWNFVRATGYDAPKLGENLAAGFVDAHSTVKAWMASPSHRDNLLDPTYSQVGFGFANAPDYTAAGGGPMTIIVAFYGSGNGGPTTPRPTLNTQVPASLESDSGRTLANQTIRAEIALNNNQVYSWIPVAIILGMVATVVVFLHRHGMSLRQTIVNGEKFVYKHPLFDLGLLLILGLLIMLYQTAGYIL